MKNCEEMAKNVFEKSKDILNKRAEKRRNTYKYAITAAAFCFAIVIGVGMSHRGLENPPLNSNEVFGGGDTNKAINEIYPEIGYDNAEKRDQAMTEADINTGGSMIMIDSVSSMQLISGETSSPPQKTENPDKTGAMDIAKGLFYINHITGRATAAKRAFDRENYYGVDWSAEEAEKYIGIDIDAILAQLPDDMVYIPHSHNIIMKTDGSIADDGVHFFIEDGKGGSITISAGRVLPPYDCIYTLRTESVNELVCESGTVTLLVGGNYDEEKESFDFIFADFELEGVKFRIEFENIQREKIIASVLRTILKVQSISG